MLPNPLISLFRDPVWTLAALGYALMLAMLLVLTLGWAWNNFHMARAQFRKNWSRWDGLPPASWLLRVAAIPGILWIDAWALAALVWLVSP